MELTPKQQIIDQIKKAKRILITSHVRPDGDAIGSTTALYLVLKKMGKEAVITLPELAPRYLSFLPATGTITKEVVGSQDFIISLDQKAARVAKIGYNLENDKLNIVVTPTAGKFTPQDVNYIYGGFNFDLIIILDCPDWDQLGPTYEASPALFLETPTINIDHHATNEYFGTINLVELTATSTCEILVGIIEALGKEYLDENVATSLLAGITTDTGSFQNNNTTPKSLTVAAQLVAAGARQQEIVKYIFNSKPLSTLKLWGKALANINEDKNLKMVWSSLSLKDFEATGATEAEASGLIDDLLKSAEGAEIVILLTERSNNQTTVSLRTFKGVSAAEIAQLFGGGGHPSAAGFRFAGSLLEAEPQIIDRIKGWRQKRMASPQSKSGPAKKFEEKRSIKPEKIEAPVKAPVEAPIETPVQKAPAASAAPAPDDLALAPLAPDSEQVAPIIVDKEVPEDSNEDKGGELEKYPTLKKFIQGEEKSQARKKQFRPPHL